MKPEQRKQDYYSRQAKSLGLIARSAFKLQQINNKFYVIKKGQLVIDLGAAPGAWSELASKMVGDGGFVLGIDLLPVAKAEKKNLMFIRGDLLKQKTVSEVENILKNKKADVVLSDMAPEFSGVKRLDIGRAMNLSEMALEFTKYFLKPKGSFVCKLFHGSGYDELIKDLRSNFESVKTWKPPASRKESSEIYVVCKNYLKKTTTDRTKNSNM